MSTLLAAWLVTMKRFDGVELVIDPEQDVGEYGFSRTGKVLVRAPRELHADGWGWIDQSPVNVSLEPSAADGRPRRKALREERDHTLSPPREEEP